MKRLLSLCGIFLLLLMLCVGADKELATAYAHMRGWQTPGQNNTVAWSVLEHKAWVAECPLELLPRGFFYTGLFRRDTDNVFRCVPYSPGDDNIYFEHPVLWESNCHLERQHYVLDNQTIVHYVRFCQGAYVSH